MKKTKIDWCDCTINPVIGCKRGCPYCYAKKINDRFHFVKDFANPEFKSKAIEKPFFGTKPLSVFCDSMSDIEYWPEEARRRFIDYILDSWGDHSFILLTKSPSSINNWKKPRDHGEEIILGKSNLPQILFLGYSCGSAALATKALMEMKLGEGLKADFLSLEPLEEDIRTVAFSLLMEKGLTPDLRLVIIGAETGNRKGKVECKKEWVDGIVKICDGRKIPVFMKSSLKEIMGKDFRQDKLPWPCSKRTEGTENER